MRDRMAREFSPLLPSVLYDLKRHGSCFSLCIHDLARFTPRCASFGMIRSTSDVDNESARAMSAVLMRVWPRAFRAWMCANTASSEPFVGGRRRWPEVDTTMVAACVEVVSLIFIEPEPVALLFNRLLFTRFSPLYSSQPMHQTTEVVGSMPQPVRARLLPAQ